jgi:nitrogen-specific signal transduction histidine kinase/CheY-like chemotaxis protein
MVVARNMTERKQWERALRDSGRKEAVGALAEGVAHNLSNIMGVIRGYALAIVDNVIPNTKAHEYTQRILDAAEHAVHVSRRLMAMAESSDAAGETQAQPVSLDEVIRDTLDMVEHAFGLQNVRVEVRNSGNLPRVSANAGQLLDVLMSVLMNSAEAMPRGGVVTLDAVERHVPRPPRANPKAAPGTYVALRVRDTGAGMKRGVARRVFEPFFSTKKEGASIGLGLTIAQSMMHGMGGWMDIRGREGAGCMARLFLRKAEAPAPAEAAPPPAAAGRAILLVDDRLEELTMMKEALAREGYTVHAAADAKSGAAMYRQNAERIALTVVDLLMPKAGGRHVLEEILRLDPQANVIVTSGFSRDFARGSLPAGGWRFLQKPFSPQRLVSRVNHLLRGTADSESE